MATERSAAAYRQLRRLIVSGRLPPGARLIEMDLARRLGFSRTPIRGALRILLREGYVLAPDSGKRRRVVVAPYEIPARMAQLAVNRPLGEGDLHDHPPHPFHIWKVFFECEVVGGEPRATLEASDASFWPLDELPDLSTGRVTEAQIRRLHRVHQEPTAPTMFD